MPPLDVAELKKVLESLLFVAKRPLPLGELEKTTGSPVPAIEAALEELIADYQGRGVKIFKVAGGYLMGTAPENAQYLENFLYAKVETTLSPQALETLAIIAYKQPVTRVEIERLRGVISDGVVETLLVKKLIFEKGRSESVGRPYLYATTTEFLRHFGLKDLCDLPPLPTSLPEQEALFKSALHE